MRPVLPTTTSAQLAGKRTVALPVGSFEQHGSHLPVTTDTIIANEIARRAAETYDLALLAPVTFSCSQEHQGFPGVASLRADTLAAVIEDIADSLTRWGVDHLVVVNGHGGNNVLTNVVQQANVERRRLLLFPTSYHWTTARTAAGCEASTHQDMHAGEAETSILLHVAPELVRDGWRDADHEADDRSLLTLLGMAGYTDTGVIGRPSLATPQKGAALLHSLVEQLAEPLKLLDT